MIFGLVLVSLITVFLAPVTQGTTPIDTGDGYLYKLKVVQDVTLESGSRNYNYLPYLLVGKHPDYPNKRSLVKFENLPANGCPHNRIRWANMYLYFVYAHKASWHSVAYTPYISRRLHVYQVKKQWDESQATSLYRLSGQPWSQQYLGLDDTDAESSPQSTTPVTMYSYRPSGFVEFDVTDAVQDWIGGTPNYGLVVRAINEYDRGRGLRFASNADGNHSRHAFITVLCAKV